MASPWYYDPYTPAYLPESRVVVWDGYNCGWNDGDAYEYDPDDPYYAYGDYQLNYGLSTLSVCYRSRNVSVIADLMGDCDIGIFADGRYEYSVSPDDFSAMMSDTFAARTSRRIRYHVRSVPLWLRRRPLPPSVPMARRLRTWRVHGVPDASGRRSVCNHRLHDQRTAVLMFPTGSLIDAVATV